jgi:phosphinothricin acetyltransferase
MAMPDVTLRLATPADLPAINEIYNHFVLHSTCTYQTEPETAEGRAAWFARHGPLHPVTVAQREGTIVGWGSISPFHARAAYGHTVENSVYVHPDWHRKGIGRAILMDLIQRTAAIGHHTIIALIDADQAASVALHAALGFARVGHLREVGHKFGRWLDVQYMQLILSSGGDARTTGATSHDTQPPTAA